MAQARQETEELASNGTGMLLARIFTRYRLLANLLLYNLLFTLSLLLAYVLIFEVRGSQSNWFYSRFIYELPGFLLVKSVVFGYFKLFRGQWQYSGIRDVVNILVATLISLVIFYMAVLVLHKVPQLLQRQRLWNYSNGLLILDFLSTVFLTCTARLSVRLYYEELRPVSASGFRRVLVVGAGNAAETLLREINRMRVERYRVVGLVDDDPNKQGLLMHGVQVLGTSQDIKSICEEEKVDEILISVPSATQKELRRIIDACQGTKLHFQTLPSMDALIEGRATVSQIRKVEINDLLGREAVQLDTQAVAGFIRDRRVMITGAGGSIGSEMCRQVAHFRPARLILLEQAENSLFNIANELRHNFPELPLSTVICDIYDRARVLAVFAAEGPEVVIHAAAHKHVPLMELNSCEAIKNNIFGTRNIADASCLNGVAEFVMISTDKAVNPSSIMGATKRVAELYTQSLNGQADCRTQFKAVRFGNVLGSSGSVVPIFEEQIRRGGPVTVTHPEMKRYFMTIPEASQLVLQAAATGQGGQIFLLDMGEPVKIVDLARDMITLSGLRVGDDIDIQFTGMRPGEKLFEELRTVGEDVEPTVHPKVKIWKHRPTPWPVIRDALAEMESLVNCPDRQRIIEALRRLVPEYAPPGQSDQTAAPARQQPAAGTKIGAPEN
jgi:FlaA1/EpsC-like NDP-sugar epimerase